MVHLQPELRISKFRAPILDFTLGPPILRDGPALNANLVQKKASVSRSWTKPSAPAAREQSRRRFSSTRSSRGPADGEVGAAGVVPARVAGEVGRQKRDAQGVGCIHETQQGRGRRWYWTKKSASFGPV
jgi:hypothetical protein